MVSTKNVKEVYEFYLEWKSTTHYKSYKSHVGNISKSTLEDYVWFLVFYFNKIIINIIEKDEAQNIL